MQATTLLKKIISKGGVIGSCGKYYANDEALATDYIIECSQHLHISTVRNLWGKQLVKQIDEHKIRFTKKCSGLNKKGEVAPALDVFT